MSETFSGTVRIQDGDGRDVFRFTSNNGILRLGVEGNEGDLRIVDGAGRTSLNFDAQTAILSIGVNGNEGDIRVQDQAGRRVFNFDGGTATLVIGAAGNEGHIRIVDDAGNNRILLDGSTGDIRLLGADCAEDFDVRAGADCRPGQVMVLDEQGQLVGCRQPYDRKVVGVVSGAGAYRPGLILDSRPAEPSGRRAPIAVMGKVACLVDADLAAVSVGDMLTTSGTPGHAMKADDPQRSRGAILGKALGALPAGRGLVNMFVSMQ